MGYYTHVDGSIDIRGSVKYTLVADSRFNPESPKYEHSVIAIKYSFEQTQVTVAEGLLLTKKLVGIVPITTQESYKAGAIVDDLQEAVDEITAGEDHVEFTDWLEGHGEEHDDHWRLVVVDDKVVKVKGRIVYDLPTGFKKF